MTDTPRTDLREFDISDGQGAMGVTSAFARELERQLAAVTKERDELRRIANGFSLNVEHMLARTLPPSQPPASANVALYLELGQWAVNLNAWREELQQLSQKEVK
jgi:hypothetical protein